MGPTDPPEPDVTLGITAGQRPDPTAAHPDERLRIPPPPLCPPGLFRARTLRFAQTAHPASSVDDAPFTLLHTGGAVRVGVDPGSADVGEPLHLLGGQLEVHGTHVVRELLD